ncbi:MAG: hypothetical protein AAGL18_13690, partial [Pseudomonadota bacterium]
GGSALVTGMIACLVALSFVEIPHLKFHIFLLAFYLGALVPKWGVPVISSLRLNSPAYAAVFVFALVFLAGVIQRVYKPWLFIEPVSLLFVAPACAIIVAMVLHGAGKRFLNHPFLIHLGDLSYSMYLIHFAILFALARGAAQLLPTQLQPAAAIAANLALGLLTFVLVIPISQLTYSYIELPFQNLGRKVSRAILSRPHGA